MQQEYIASSLGDLESIAIQFLKDIGKCRKLTFKGQVGAGKTTFIKKLCQKLGVTETTSSPTFALINQYESDFGTINHIDLYRLKDEQEALNIGIEELFYDNSYCFIEWPEIIEAYLPENVVEVEIEVDEKFQRKFKISY